MEALRSAMEARRRVDALLGAASGAEALEVRAVDAAKRRALAAAPSAPALRACFPAGARVRVADRTHQHFLSLPHTLGLLALTVASLAAQQYYRLRDYAVVVVNGGFFVLAAILFWHSSKTAKRARN